MKTLILLSSLLFPLTAAADAPPALTCLSVLGTQGPQEAYGSQCHTPNPHALVKGTVIVPKLDMVEGVLRETYVAGRCTRALPECSHIDVVGMCQPHVAKTATCAELTSPSATKTTTTTTTTERTTSTSTTPGPTPTNQPTSGGTKGSKASQ